MASQTASPAATGAAIFHAAVARQRQTATTPPASAAPSIVVINAMAHDDENDDENDSWSLSQTAEEHVGAPTSAPEETECHLRRGPSVVSETSRAPSVHSTTASICNDADAITVVDEDDAGDADEAASIARDSKLTSSSESSSTTSEESEKAATPTGSFRTAVSGLKRNPTRSLSLPGRFKARRSRQRHRTTLDPESAAEIEDCRRVFAEGFDRLADNHAAMAELVFGQARLDAEVAGLQEQSEDAAAEGAVRAEEAAREGEEAAIEREKAEVARAQAVLKREKKAAHERAVERMLAETVPFSPLGRVVCDVSEIRRVANREFDGVMVRESRFPKFVFSK